MFIQNLFNFFKFKRCIKEIISLLKRFFFLHFLFLILFGDKISNTASSFSLSKSLSLSQSLHSCPMKVAIIGSGNWGCAIGKVVASNAKSSYLFDDNVRIWVYEEIVNGHKLTDLINEKHENVKYLPGIKLPSNLKALSTLKETIKDADLLIFVLPHQFLNETCESIKALNLVNKDAKALSLVKGLYLDSETNPKLSSQIISDTLGIECSVLSGANVAKDVAMEQFSEATIGYKNQESAKIWQILFDTPYFKINGVPDIFGVEVCGALKNVIALAAGFSDGLNLGSNTKAALIRQGFQELKIFSSIFFDGILEETFLDSSGIADTITTCFGGRNVKCSAEFVKFHGKKSWNQIEKEFLNGQKLQGPHTCEDLNKIIKKHKLESLFPLFDVTYKIAFKGYPAEKLIETFMVKNLRQLKFSKDCTSTMLPYHIRHYKINKNVDSF